MPITLITGLPGHGKTLYALARWKDSAIKEGRPVFHNSIRGLNIPGWQEWPAEDWEKLPAGAIMVIDECQKPFPVRGRGEPPPHINNLATHRHLGLDFVVITQNPMLMDSFVRRLVDRHFHVVRKFGTHRATIHEFPNGVKENVASSRDGSIRHEWKYPKDVFDLYQSAELHTVKRRIPMRVWILLALPVVLAALVWFAYHRMKPENVQARMDAQAGITADQRQSMGGNNQRPAQRETLTPVQYAQAHTPRVDGLPHTAPIYDEVTKPTQAPYPAACIANKDKCRCYSQQGTALEMVEDLCRRIADGGFFIAWQQQAVHAVPTHNERKVE
ncbi:zonular occludens toxin domain-containing protein [Roseateles microcysteis]|uniref:zonular occludens toxin domain-containing protein n=1 Tax=Roseateles microcysteis TaxID=3119057 RepID=UPI002FE52D28